ncbi:MAG TPA: cysteine--tRNA ligase [Thiotrichaceae bacterium]|nr:cysteine--tRNA ligase [Thiotrichaceae bacterium]
MLQVYNSLTNQKENFVPINPEQVRMYVCGMTVYDHCHLGHARVLIVFDTIFRHLKALNYDVIYVRNITDIDDKIIARANEKNEPFETLTQRFIDAMHDDEKALGLLSPSIEPRATDHMPDIITMIQDLEAKDYAYAADNGDVYYRVAKFKNYGKLSGRLLEELRAGERIAIDKYKQDPLDFVLWKAAKADEPYWDSPWGKGRPGWHIECSAMSTQHLGNHFDIHGGGHDLQFPHHENEIAQSEACTGEHFANYWLHNGFIRIDQEKMSKSLGNFFTIRDVLKDYKGEEIRYYMLTSQYRSPLNYSTAQLDNARSALERLYTALRGIEDGTANDDSPQEALFMKAMNDDFNTPEALAVLFDLARDCNRQKQNQPEQAIQTAALLKKLGGQLGLLQTDAEAWFKSESSDSDMIDEDINQLIKQRDLAKQEKDWTKADQIRDQLNALNIELEDTPKGTTWRRK